MQDYAVIYGSLIIGFMENIPVEFRYIALIIGIVIGVFKIIEGIYNFFKWIKNKGIRF